MYVCVKEVCGGEAKPTFLQESSCVCIPGFKFGSPRICQSLGCIFALAKESIKILQNI